jgi:hypothetical protein
MWGRARILCVFLAAAFVACTEFGARAQTKSIDAGKNDVGVSPAEFDLLPSGADQQGQWRAVHDTTAAAGLVIEQPGMDATEDRFPLAIYKSASLKNVEVSLRLKATGGKTDRDGGVAVRLTTPDNYYLVQLDALRDRVILSRVTNGAPEEIVGVDADIASHTWHTLGVRARDDEFVVSLDGVWMFTGFDKAIPHAGRIALWTKGDSATRFDSITITPLTASEQRY